jgi:hypothetical protein
MGIGGEVQRIEMAERETPVFGGVEFDCRPATSKIASGPAASSD